MADTHEVTNQAPPLVDYDVFTADAALVEGVQRHDADWAVEDLTALGRRAGTAEAQEWGRLANDYPPKLRTLDRTGRRIDEVEFHPAWHELMSVALGAGLHASPWVRPGPGPTVAAPPGLPAGRRAEAGTGGPAP